jgi:hypothetical protein
MIVGPRNNPPRPNVSRPPKMLTHARHHKGDSEQRALRQSDQDKTVEGCANRNNNVLAKVLSGWTK